eukprot:TRINITY_DN11150_c0_g2_i1.p1 TRINITY_DN11150_c0_g2~~TRINITY_DN11150_c0_g2_i1.p1  ORF type:complete len:323 (-),score=-48.14 TRINITY_DN11150_c0_g2_i1:566-1534(-)
MGGTGGRGEYVIAPLYSEQPRMPASQGGRGGRAPSGFFMIRYLVGLAAHIQNRSKKKNRNAAQNHERGLFLAGGGCGGGERRERGATGGRGGLKTREDQKGRGCVVRVTVRVGVGAGVTRRDLLLNSVQPRLQRKRMPSHRGRSPLGNSSGKQKAPPHPDTSTKRKRASELYSLRQACSNVRQRHTVRMLAELAHKIRAILHQYCIAASATRKVVNRFAGDAVECCGGACVVQPKAYRTHTHTGWAMIRAGSPHTKRGHHTHTHMRIAHTPCPKGPVPHRGTTWLQVGVSFSLLPISVSKKKELSCSASSLFCHTPLRCVSP